MTLTDKISHAAERKAFETLLDNLIKNGQTHDASQVASDLVAMVQRLHGDVWSEKSFQTLRMIANDPNGKWAHYTQRLLRDNDPYILKTFLTNAVYEGGIRGYHVAQETAAKYDINVPWLILMDPTSACNMHCTGCWAAEYGHKQSLTFEEMDKTLTEAKALGTHACLFTGGEPLMRKKDIIRLCEKHRDIAFHAFTNGTLIDDEFCKEMLRVGNFFVSVSIEGFEEANDGRRGDGHFQRRLPPWTACAATAFRSAFPSATRAETTRSSRATNFWIFSSPRAASSRGISTICPSGRTRTRRFF